MTSGWSGTPCTSLVGRLLVLAHQFHPCTAVNYGRSLELTGVLVTEARTSQQIRLWERPPRNDTKGTAGEIVYAYDDNAFGRRVVQRV